MKRLGPILAGILIAQGAGAEAILPPTERTRIAVNADETGGGDSATTGGSALIKTARGVGYFVGVEAILAALSYASRGEPKLYGGALLAGAPFTIDPLFITEFALLGLYNATTLAGDDVTGNERFQKNFIGWNLIAATAALRKRSEPAPENASRAWTPVVALAPDRWVLSVRKSF